MPRNADQNGTGNDAAATADVAEREPRFAKLGVAPAYRVVFETIEEEILSGRLRPGEGVTRLFLRPGSEFRVVDALLTNFHLPRSSLLMLVAAFAGREPVLAAYAEAVAEGYRFYSYGDAMFVS